MVSQNDVEAQRGASRDEVRLLLSRMGFEPVTDVARPDDYVNVETGEEINDLHDENAVIDRDGGVSVFDPFPRMLWSSKQLRVRQALDEATGGE